MRGQGCVGVRGMTYCVYQYPPLISSFVVRQHQSVSCHDSPGASSRQGEAADTQKVEFCIG